MEISRALEIAKIAHVGQVDKAGMPYIGHPVRVSQAVLGKSDKVVALLHDVIEDTDMQLTDAVFLSLTNAERAGLDAVTWRKGEEYHHYIKRLSANPIAVRVKLADLADNMNLGRISNPTDRDYKRNEKYQIVKMYLESVAVY